MQKYSVKFLKGYLIKTFSQYFNFLKIIKFFRTNFFSFKIIKPFHTYLVSKHNFIKGKMTGRFDKLWRIFDQKVHKS